MELRTSKQLDIFRLVSNDIHSQEQNYNRNTPNSVYLRNFKLKYTVVVT